MKRVILTEEEKGDIKSQHDDIDTQLMTFLLRRFKKEERDINAGWEDVKPFKVTEYSFEGLPGYGFNSFSSKPSKGTITASISTGSTFGEFIGSCIPQAFVMVFSVSL